MSAEGITEGVDAPTPSAPSPQSVWNFKIPCLPTSMNAIYGFNANYKRMGHGSPIYLKNECLLWKSKAKLFVPKISAKESDRFGISYDVHANWYYKNGKLKKVDGHNFQKLLLDAVVEKQDWDDNLFRVWRGEMFDNSAEEYVYVTIYKL